MFKYYFEQLVDNVKNFYKNEKKKLIKIAILIAIIVTLILSFTFYHNTTTMVVQLIFFSLIYLCVIVVIGIFLFTILGVLWIGLLNNFLAETKYETLVLTLICCFTIIMVILDLIIYISIILSSLKSIYFPVCKGIISFI